VVANTVASEATTSSDDATGSAVLDFYFRNTQTAPFPSSLFGLPVTIRFHAEVTQENNAFGFVLLDDFPLIKKGGGTQEEAVTLTLDAAPDQVFHIQETAGATPNCRGRPPTMSCEESKAIIDPVISFDQQSFDDLAAQRGVPSVPLDQFFTLDFSPDLDVLPLFPVDIEQIFGPGPVGVAEPPALVMLLVAIGLLAAALRARRPRRSLTR
jgi:hypothetical protein